MVRGPGLKNEIETADETAEIRPDRSRLHDRLGLLRDAGAAMTSSTRSRPSDDILEITRRVEALTLLGSDDGRTAGYKRAANILAAEEKKDKTTFAGAVDADLLTTTEESPSPPPWPW